MNYLNLSLRIAYFALLGVLLFLISPAARASLIVRAEEPKQTGNKVVIKLTMTNTFQKKIESARAQIFLLDDEGKVVAQATQWIIGGLKNKRPLAPGGAAEYNFVLSASKPFTSTKLTCSRIILEGGEFANPQNDFEIVK